MSADFRLFYQSHSSLVRKVAYQIAGRSLRGPALDDLVQEAFVKIWRGLSDFRNESEITSWIYRVTTNAALDHLKVMRRKREDFVSDEIEIPDTQSSIEETHAARELVERGLECLSEDQRTILVLVYLHERPLKEVALVLGVPEGTVKSRLHTARTAFIAFLESKGVSADVDLR